MIGRGHDTWVPFMSWGTQKKSLEVWIDWVEKAVGFWRKWIKISREGQSVKCEKEKAGVEMTVKRGLDGSVWRYAKLPRGGGSS